MDGVKDRVYYGDSKITVRRKLELDKDHYEEDFFEFELVLFSLRTCCKPDRIVRVYAPLSTGTGVPSISK